MTTTRRSRRALSFMFPGWLRVCQSGETLTLSGCTSHSLLITALLLFAPIDRFYWLRAFSCFPVSAASKSCLLLCPSRTCLLSQLPATHSRRCLFRGKADRLDLPSCMKYQPIRTQINSGGSLQFLCKTCHPFFSLHICQTQSEVMHQHRRFFTAESFILSNLSDLDKYLFVSLCFTGVKV